MKNIYRVPSAALRDDVVSSTLTGKTCNVVEAGLLTIGQFAGGAGLSFGL